jgi:hypothetical protein
MLRYKNLPLAYAFQIIWCLSWTFIIYIYGYKGLAFGAVGAFRPIVLKMERISNSEIPWRQNYQILLYSVITFSCLVILFYFIDIFFLPSNFISVNKPNIFLSFLPVFLLIHGVLGLAYLYFNAEIKNKF